MQSHPNLYTYPTVILSLPSKHTMRQRRNRHEKYIWRRLPAREISCLSSASDWNILHSAVFGSGNGSSPVLCQNITWVDTVLYSIGPFWKPWRDWRQTVKVFHSRKCIWKCCLQNVSHVVQAPSVISSMGTYVNVIVKLSAISSYESCVTDQFIVSSVRCPRIWILNERVTNSGHK